MDISKTVIEFENNKVTFVFELDDTFDQDILIKMENAFLKLVPTKILSVVLKGHAPIESVAYCAEVSAHCNMILTLGDDDSFNFVTELQKTNPTTIKLIKGEKERKKRNTNIQW